MTIFRTLLITGIAVLLTSACGIKPKNVDAPAGAEEKPFPSSYPKNVSK